MEKSAILSTCGTFRYELHRRWDSFLPCAAFIMLNPSTADANVDDPTIRKCIGFAQRLGFGELRVVNLFAYRATDPAALRAADWPVGPDNDWHIELAVKESSDAVICAWGANARGLSRTDEVLSMISKWSSKPKALSLLSDGTPAHPLMLPYSDTWIDLETGTRSDRRQVMRPGP